MLVRLFGRVMAARAPQSRNALSPMLVTPSGRVMAARAPQPRNASSPMPVTLAGRFMAVSVGLPALKKKAPAPTVVTVKGLPFPWMVWGTSRVGRVSFGSAKPVSCTLVGPVSLYTRPSTV